LELTNKLAYGYTLGDVTGGYFMNSGFGVSFEESVTRVMTSNLSPDKTSGIKDLHRQVIVSGSFDVSTHSQKRKLIEDQNLSAHEHERKKTDLVNVAIVSQTTKHASESLIVRCKRRVRGVSDRWFR
jgi:hypothetical protein